MAMVWMGVTQELVCYKLWKGSAISLWESDVHVAEPFHSGCVRHQSVKNKMLQVVVVP